MSQLPPGEPPNLPPPKPAPRAAPPVKAPPAKAPPPRAPQAQAPSPIPVAGPGPSAPQFAPSSPTRSYGKKSNPALIVISILGGVALLVVLMCGGGFFFFVYKAKAKIAEASKRVQEVNRQQMREIERAQQQEFARQQELRRQEQVRQQQEAMNAQRRTKGKGRIDSAPVAGGIHSNPVTPMPAPIEEKPLPVLEQRLLDLASRDPTRILQASAWFAQQKADPAERAKVQAALVALLGSGDKTQTNEVIGALVVWGDAAELKTQFTAKLNDPDNNQRTPARQILKTLKVSDEELSAQAMSDLAAADALKRAEAIRWLGEAALSPEKRVEATKAIGGVLAKDQDGNVREQALQTLLADKSQESSDALLPLVVQGNDRWTQALHALMQRGDKRVADPLGKLVKERLTMGQALHAIRTADASGEDVVLHLITRSTDGELVRHVCFALSQSGTKKSLPALQKVLAVAEQRKDAGAKIAAEHAIKAITARGE